MGTVIAWPGHLAGAGRRSLGVDEPRGQILFFTGVRYERRIDNGEPTGANASSKGRGAQRGRRKRA